MGMILYILEAETCEYFGIYVLKRLIKMNRFSKLLLIHFLLMD